MSADRNERLEIVIDGERVFRMFKSPKTRMPGKELWETLGEQRVLDDVVVGESMRFKEKDGVPPTITTPVAEIESDGMDAYIVKTAGGSESRGSVYRLVKVKDKNQSEDGMKLLDFAPMNVARVIGAKIQGLFRN